jgi:hypothetical protein
MMPTFDTLGDCVTAQRLNVILVIIHVLTL